MKSVKAAASAVFHSAAVRKEAVIFVRIVVGVVAAHFGLKVA